MPSDSVDKLNKILDVLEKSGKDRNEINKIRTLIDLGKLSEALQKIREINGSNAGNSSSNDSTERKSNKRNNSRSNNSKTKNKSEKDKKEKQKKSGNKSDETNTDDSENINSKKKTRKKKKKIENENVKNEDSEKTNNAEDYYTEDKIYEEEDTTINEKNEDDFWDSSEEDDIERADEDSSETEEEQYQETSKNDENESDTEQDHNDEDDYSDDDDEDDDEDLLKKWTGEDDDEVVYKEEVKKQESIFPESLRAEDLEKTYVGLLLNNPKLIVKYYILFEECYFDDQSLLNIYKSILFTEGGKYTPEIAKKGFSFSVDNNETYRQKQQLKSEISAKECNPEKVYLELRKIFIIRKSFLEEPREDIQEKIIDIRNYELYDQMSADEIKAAIVQVSVTQKFKQAVLSENLTDFLERGENNLTNGLALPFPIISSVFKGIRKGETMAFAMPSNSGKSRFTINIAAYTAFVHKKKVLVISNEMSEEKMKLCLITTVLNNPEIQKQHGQVLSKTEGELLEFKFRPNKDAKVEVDDNGFILQNENETRREFVERLKKVSDEFNKTIAVTDWLNNQINNSIYFINITDHTNDELKKVIMNYYYKEKIEYVFYDTLKTDTANIGNGEEIKRTATILSNLAQNFNIFIFSTLQLTESSTMPINLTVNDLAVSRTVKEVLDTLCLIKQIMRDDLDKYEYSLEEVDTKFFDLKKYKDPDERYYACVIDKNRAGAKPKLLFNLNLAYNRWVELGFLKLKDEK